MMKFLKLIPILFVFLACEQGVIFHDIAQEIKLEEPNILGNINSVVKLEGTLYTQNGNVYKKELGTIRGWTKISAPGRVIMLASDVTYLYALTAEQEGEDGYIHKYQVHVLNASGGWDPVTGASITVNSEEDTTSKVALFDNGVIGGADNTAGRNAYIRINSTVSLLAGDALGATQNTNGAGALTIAAASRGATDYFSDSRVFCSNNNDADETNDILYTIQDGVLKTSTDNTDWTVPSVSISITDATTMVYADDKLYVGTSEGLEQVTLDASGDPTGKSNLGSNAEAATGEKEITAIGYFSTYDGSAIYTGAISQYSTKNNGLWGYYPSRGNWNFE